MKVSLQASLNSRRLLEQHLGLFLTGLSIAIMDYASFTSRRNKGFLILTPFMRKLSRDIVLYLKPFHYQQGGTNYVLDWTYCWN
jgi:hypothetical protein